MYEVFINNKRLIFERTDAIKNYDRKWKKIQSGERNYKPASVFALIEDGPSAQGIVIFSDHPEKSFDHFFRDCQLIEAAGGLVTNPLQQVLFIFRKDKWDLPKGKIEKRESPEKAAVREVQEETGVDDLKIIRHLAITFHTYRIGKKNVLKKTHWFEMKTKSGLQFIPQAEEGITEVKWLNKRGINKALKNSYPLIEGLIIKFNDKINKPLKSKVSIGKSYS